MREKPRDKGRLQHMLQAIDNVEEFIADLDSYEGLISNKILYFAVVKNIEIVGEAAYMLTPDFKESHPQLPWKDIIGMRHILVHGYYNTTPYRVWNTATVDLSEMKPILQSFIEELSEDESDSVSINPR